MVGPKYTREDAGTDVVHAMIAFGAIGVAEIVSMLSVFETVMEIPLEVATFPRESRETATTVFVPEDVAVESHVIAYGELSSVPCSMPFTKNLTDAIDESASLVDAESVTEEPETVALASGAVKETDGASLSIVSASEDDVA